MQQEARGRRAPPRCACGESLPDVLSSGKIPEPHSTSPPKDLPDVAQKNCRLLPLQCSCTRRPDACQPYQTSTTQPANFPPIFKSNGFRRSPLERAILLAAAMEEIVSFDVASLETLKRADLQALCKRTGIKANGKVGVLSRLPLSPHSIERGDD